MVPFFSEVFITSTNRLNKLIWHWKWPPMASPAFLVFKNFRGSTPGPPYKKAGKTFISSINQTTTPHLVRKRNNDHCEIFLFSSIYLETY